jgi:hypothetical protein
VATHGLQRPSGGRYTFNYGTAVAPNGAKNKTRPNAAGIGRVGPFVPPNGGAESVRGRRRNVSPPTKTVAERREIGP